MAWVSLWDKKHPRFTERKTTRNLFPRGGTAKISQVGRRKAQHSLPDQSSNLNVIHCRKENQRLSDRRSSHRDTHFSPCIYVKIVGRGGSLVESTSIVRRDAGSN